MANDSESGISTIAFGRFVLTPIKRLLTRDGEPIAIGGRALEILIALTDRPTEIVSGRKLIDIVWPDVTVEEANLRVHIAALRKVLGDSRDGNRFVITVPGRGYAFVAPLLRSPHSGTSSIYSEAGLPQPKNLPAPLRSIAGRAETLAELIAQVQSNRLVSVVGPGGIGKTTVAIAVAHALLSDFGNEMVFFVDLGSLDDKADAASAVAAAIGCSVQGLVPDHAIPAFLADKRALLILDSCEHVMETVAPLTKHIVAGAPSIHILATSREALRVELENVHLLPPLAWPLDAAPSAASALASPAVQLFMEKAAVGGLLDGLQDSDAPIVADICRRLDGIALAIEIAASRVGTYGIRGVASLLNEADPLQFQGRRSATSRHQTLQAMLDWSFNLLSGSEQKTLCTLSIFIGQFPLDAAYTVAGVVDNDRKKLATIIASLADKSLISISSISGFVYYRLLDTTRAYASAKLKVGDEERAIAGRHALYFDSFLKSRLAGQGFDGRDAAKYTPHLGNIRKALEWSFSDRGNPAIGRELATNAVSIFLEISQFGECQRWCRQAISGLPERDRGTSLELHLYYALARSALYAPGSVNEVKDAFKRALHLSEILHDERRQFDLLADFNVYLVRNGDFEGAIATAKESAAIAQRTGDPVEKILSEWLLGASYHATGNQAAALRHCKNGFLLQAFPASSLKLDLASEARARLALTRSLWLRGFPDQALESAHETIEHMRAYSHHASYCFALVWTIPVFFWCGAYKMAAEPIESALSHASKYSLPAFQAIARAQKGEFLLVNGDDSTGLEMLQQGYSTMLSSQYSIIASSTSCVLSKALAASARGEEARQVLEVALSRADLVNERCWRPELLRTQGEIELMMPQPDLASAEQFLLRSISCAREQSAYSWELKAAIPLAQMWRDLGKNQEARSLLGSVYQRFTEGFGTRDLIAACQLLDQL
jgi:predicted ATPase/DNA-binding winged helix-turn-helix (wHTH) protein